MKRTDKITAMAALVALMAAPLAAQQKATDEGMVFTEEEVNPPQKEMIFTEEEVNPPLKEMVFTEEEVDDTPPEIEAPEAPEVDPCGNWAQLLEVISAPTQLTMAAGPANVTTSDKKYEDSTIYKGPAELAFVEGRGKFTFWSKNSILFIPNLVLDVALGPEVSPEWQKVFSNSDYKGIDPQDLMNATGCYDMLELFGVGQGTISRHGGFDVSIRLRLAFAPDTAGDFIGSMTIDGEDDAGRVVHYEVPVTLSR